MYGNTYKVQDPWTMADWQPAPEVYLHNLVIARKLRKDLNYNNCDVDKLKYESACRKLLYLRNWCSTD